MIIIHTAPIPLTDIEYPMIFLAGGITGCRNWQDDVCLAFAAKAKLHNDHTNYAFLNPRRENFPIDDPNASYEQIKWEFDHLEKCDCFSMFFCKDRIQPICLYELGRNLERMKQRFPDDWMNRIIITAHKDYERLQDVLIQTKLATDDKVKVNIVDDSNDISTHAIAIYKAVSKNN